MLQIPGLRFWSPSIKFDHGINWKGLYLVLSGWRVTWISSLEWFLKVLCLPSTTVVKTEDFEKGFLISFFLILHFQSLGTMAQFPLKSRVGNETWLKKLTEVCNYGKFICNIFGWYTVKIGFIRAKVDLKICVCLNRTKPLLESNITFNQYSIRSFQKALVGFNNFWI